MVLAAILDIAEFTHLSGSHLGFAYIYVVKLPLVSWFGFYDSKNMFLDSKTIFMSFKVKKSKAITEFTHLCGGHLGFFYVYLINVTFIAEFRFYDPQNI